MIDGDVENPILENSGKSPSPSNLVQVSQQIGEVNFDLSITNFPYLCTRFEDRLWIFGGWGDS